MPTPLISTTDSEDHAWRLACNREEHGRTNIHVAIIDRDRLESYVNVYRMLDLVRAIDAEIAPKAYSRHEHVCVYRIPIDCIVRFYTLSEFMWHINGDSSDGDNEEEEELWLKWLDEEELQSPEDEEEGWWPLWVEPKYLSPISDWHPRSF